MQSAYLTRIDSGRNMARFYTMSLQETLFRECSLVREWGRIGRGGQVSEDTFPTIEDAEAALARLYQAKLKRGYVGNV